MKVGALAVFVAVVVSATALYYDSMARDEIYQFCQANASGNPIDELKARAVAQSFRLKRVDQQTLELTKQMSGFFFNEYFCEVKIADDRITSQALLKRSIYF